MVLYMAPVAAEEQMNVSPEEMKKGMEPWNAWYKKCGKAIVDMGAPLGKGMCLDKKGSSKGQDTGNWVFYCSSKRHGSGKSNVY